MIVSFITLLIWRNRAVEDSLEPSLGTASLLDCDPFDRDQPLSEIARAVLEVVGDQNYCWNVYDRVIKLPPGREGFLELARRAEAAKYEVVFATMSWDDERTPEDDGDPEADNSPGVILLQGIQRLYEKYTEHPSRYPDGIHVRILLGIQRHVDSIQINWDTQRPISTSLDQRVYVLQAAKRLGIPAEEEGWKFEVATYRHARPVDPVPVGGIHSHVKVLVVDGAEAAVLGYNMQYKYFDRKESESGGSDHPMHDFGVGVTGPIVTNVLEVFEYLWVDSRTCEGIARKLWLDVCESEGRGSGGVFLAVQPGSSDESDSVAVFSLFRNHEPDNKLSDAAIAAAIGAAQNKINIIQNRYYEGLPTNYKWCGGVLFRCPLQSGTMLYTDALVKASNANPNLHLYILLPVSGDMDIGVNFGGIDNLRSQLRHVTNLHVCYFSEDGFDTPNHAKALSIDGQFLIIGSQNWDFSAFGLLPENLLARILPWDLAEYNLGIDSQRAAKDFDKKYDEMRKDCIEMYFE